MSRRKPAVAGTFYPSNRQKLTELLEKLDRNVQEVDLPEKINILGGIVPHAGYSYSGSVAMSFFKLLSKYNTSFDTLVILHPNHHGYGADIATDPNDEWETPLGVVSVDKSFSDALQLAPSHAAHAHEHSAEVMIPFMQYTLPFSFSIVAVAMKQQDPETALILTKKLTNAMQVTGKRVLVIASCDFSHYVRVEQGIALDNKVLPHIMSLDYASVYSTVMRHNISMCGYGPIMTLTALFKELQPPAKTHLLERGHSGLINRSDRVVHYISMLYYQDSDQ
ncbi:MAG TPA: AmmeMemoRadiSam system protein B [Bacteroidales bacterium]|nr:AmmeMemoRadiSam system protein B [Bacteroidales bacterium]